MNAVVGYHSRRGHTRRCAEAIAAELTTRGAQALAVPVEDLTQADVDAADIIFLGTWAQGLFVIRVRPAGISGWLPQLPDLAGKRTVGFATYRFRAAGLLRTMSDGLASRGARVVAAQAFQRDRLDGAIPALVDRALAV